MPAETQAAFSYPAPIPDQGLVNRHRLPDALHAAPLVGLVRLLRLAGPQHHRRRALIDLQEIARVGVVGLGARLRLHAEHAAGDLEHALHPVLPGLGPTAFMSENTSISASLPSSAWSFARTAA